MENIFKYLKCPRRYITLHCVTSPCLQRKSNIIFFFCSYPYITFNVLVMQYAVCMFHFMSAKRRLNIQRHKIPSHSVEVQIFPFDSTLSRLIHVNLMKSNNIETNSYSAQPPDFTCKQSSVQFQSTGHSSVTFLHCMN